MRMLAFSSLLLTMAAVLSAQAGPSGPSAPVALRCEYLINPMGVDVARPRFYWVPEHSERGERQSAYQILVSAAPAVAQGEQWDSGKVESEEFTHVVYGGRPLESGKTYYWKVRYWDSKGNASPYSRTARFDMGLLARSDWKGRWIGGGNQLRREFNLAAKPVRARAYVSGVGYYELRINGRKAGNHVLDPGWTTYDKRVLYSTYDVTPLLQQGANAVGILLGQGWYAGERAAILQLNIELPGGGRVEIFTDGSWKATQGPILADSIYNGETYDARRETPGWDSPGFQDANWKPATQPEAPKGVLSAQMMPPIRVTGVITPLKMTNPRPGVYVYDMGQNFSGWVRLRVRGPRGTRVRLRHAELLYDDGTLNVENLRSAKATDVYILRGGGEEEVYEPRFTWHGFRYVELTGFPGTPKPDTVEARVVHSAVRPTGGFFCSNETLNQVQRLILWGTKTNLHSIPSDCNQRDERMGWMADAHLAAETAMLNFDMAAFYTNFLRNMRDSQEPDGSVPDTVPRARFARGPADPAWGSAYPLFVLYMWQQYGDRRILEQHFEGIKAWTAFLRAKSENGIVSFSKFGDWVPIEKTPGNLVSTFYYYWSAQIVSQVAEILGNKQEAEAHRKLAAGIQAAFHKKFFNDETGSYSTGTQTANLLPLFLGLAPKEVAGRVFGNLRQDIVYRNNTHLTTGILGTKYLLPVLTRNNSSDLAYELATQTTYPSWGYMVANGATTLWELWQNKTGPSMNSHNHPMFGSVGAWYYQALAGINIQEQNPGYKQIRIAPQVVRDLGWVSGTVETLRGTVTSSWRRTENLLQLEAHVPVGSQAEIHLPTLGLDVVTVEESGRTIWKGNSYQPGAPGIRGVRREGGTIVVTAGSGAYTFKLSEE